MGSPAPATPPPDARERPVVVTEAALPPAAKPVPAVAAAGEPGRAHVSGQIDRLLAEALMTPTAGEHQELDHVVHRLLLVGLALSSLLMVLGLVLDVVLHRQLPTAIPDLGEMLARVRAGRPSGFLSLGLLVLLATPIVRVIGSIAAFIYERDWHYAVIALIVLVIVIVSVVVGGG